MAFLDCLRIYDQMMQDFIGSFAVEGRPVLTVTGVPDRPFAEVVQELENSSEEFRSKMMESNLIASILRLDPVYNPKLRVDIPFGPVLKDVNNISGDGIESQYPRPYILPYQIDLRARSRTDCNLWGLWVQLKFNPYVCLYPDFGLWGQKQIQLIQTPTIRDFTEKEEKGESERWIRWSVNIKILNAWIFPIITDTNDIPDPYGMFRFYRIVKKVVADIYTSPTNPPIPDLSLPGVELVDTVTRAEIDTAAAAAIESN